MILISLRILLGAALAYVFWKARAGAPLSAASGEMLGAYYVALAVLLAVANAVVWAPFVGNKVSGPLTGMLTSSTYRERRRLLLRFLRWLDERKHRSWAARIAFLEGIRHPLSPVAFVIGLNNARPGSWLEKVYAREVFRFDNAQHCVQAYRILKRRGLDPGPHSNPEVTRVLMSLEREARPEPQKLVVPLAPKPAPLKRDERIHLFDRDPPPAHQLPEDRPTPSGPAESGETKS